MTEKKKKMPLFTRTIPVSQEDVQTIAKKYWNVEIRERIKASQNHTYLGICNDTNTRQILRVTPDPTGEHYERIAAEVEAVSYFAAQPLLAQQIAAPIPILPSFRTASNDLDSSPDSPQKYSQGSDSSSQGEQKKQYLAQDLIIHDTKLKIICVSYEYAQGTAIDYGAYSWLTDQSLVTAWGTWLGRFHEISRKYAAESPLKARRVRSWLDIHQGIMQDAPLSAQDRHDLDDPKFFGVIHGDANPTNFFFEPQMKQICMFDWDQVQLFFYLYDLAQAIIGVVMLHEIGKPVSKDPIEVDVKQFTDWLVEGYESETKTAVDRERLARMVAIKKWFYWTFCRRAHAELEESDNDLLPMRTFFRYVMDWEDKVSSHQQ